MTCPVCNWPGCDAPATRFSWACAEHWPLLPEKIRGAIGHASPRPGEQPSAYFQRAGADGLAWIQRQLAKGKGGKGKSQEPLV